MPKTSKPSRASSVRRFWGGFRGEDVVICTNVYQPPLESTVKLEIAKHAGHGSLITIGTGFAMSYLWELMQSDICSNANVELITSEMPRKIGDSNWISIGSAQANDRTKDLRTRMEEKLVIDWRMKWDDSASTMSLVNTATGQVLSSDVEESNNRSGTDYALILKAPYQGDKLAMLVGGCKTYGLWAAADALKSQEFLEIVVEATNDQGEVPLSIVVRVKVVSGVPQNPELVEVSVLKSKEAGASQSRNLAAELWDLLCERTTITDIDCIAFLLGKEPGDFGGDAKSEKWIKIITHCRNRMELPALRDAICHCRKDLCEQVTALITKMEESM